MADGGEMIWSILLDFPPPPPISLFPASPLPLKTRDGQKALLLKCYTIAISDQRNSSALLQNPSLAILSSFSSSGVLSSNLTEQHFILD